MDPSLFQSLYLPDTSKEQGVLCYNGQREGALSQKSWSLSLSKHLSLYRYQETVISAHCFFHSLFLYLAFFGKWDIETRVFPMGRKNISDSQVVPVLVIHILRNQITSIGLTWWFSSLHITAWGSPSSSVPVAQSLLKLFGKTVSVSGPQQLSGMLTGPLIPEQFLVHGLLPLQANSLGHTPFNREKRNTYFLLTPPPLLSQYQPGKRKQLRAQDLVILPGDIERFLKPQKENTLGEWGTLLSSISFLQNAFLLGFMSSLSIPGVTPHKA